MSQLLASPTDAADRGEARGHVYVIRGRIGEVTADAVIVSTDRDFVIEPSWYRAIASKSKGQTKTLDGAGDLTRSEVETHRPTDWRARGYGPSPRVPGLWFLDVTDEHDDGTTSIDRLALLLTEMQDRAEITIKGRRVPVVVLPVIGTGAGGMDGRRGEVISNLLDKCARFTADHPIDLAITTSSPAAYGALQHQRLTRSAVYFPGIDLDPIRRIADAARDGSLALFIGAGASVPAGLPSWSELLNQLAARAGLSGREMDGFASLGELDKAQLLHEVMPDLAEAVREAILAAQVPALSHALLAALGCRQAVTTNYDDLYERAVGSADGVLTVVLPDQVPVGNCRWVLKMHGTVDKPSTIVLTRSQFAGFDAAAGPSGAVLQSLLLTRHLLVVGTSMTDDNVLRLIHEVLRYRAHFGSDTVRRLGTILDVSANPARERIHRDHFHWLTMQGAKLEERTRQLEIFLDCVAAHASTDTSWLLDPRYADLLSPESRSVADAVRAVAATVQGLGDTDDAWKRLGQVLIGYGAPRRPQFLAQSKSSVRSEPRDA